MEPRSRERGSEGILRPVDPNLVLQWSRVHVNAEVRCGFESRRQSCRLQWSRVHVNAEVLPEGAHAGDTAGLQWSRVHVNAEV